MATVTMATVYPVLGVDTAKGLERIGFRYLKTYRAAMAVATEADRAIFRTILGVACLGCLDTGYRWTGATRKTSVFCGCASGIALERAQRTRRTRTRSARAYAIQVITTGYHAAPQDRTFGSVQRAMAEAKRLLQTVPAGSIVDVVDRTRDAGTYRLVGRWEVRASDYERVA